MKPWISLVKRKRSPFFNYIIFEGMTNLYNTRLDFDYRYTGNLVYIDYEYLLRKEDFDIDKKIAEKRINEDPEFLLKTTNFAYKQIKKYLKLWNKIQKTNVANLSNQELAELLEEYTLSLLKWMAYLNFVTNVEGTLHEKLEALLKKLIKNKKKRKEYFILLTTPVKKSFSMGENIFLLKLNKITNKDIKKYLEKYSWIKNIGFWNKYYDEKEFKEKVENIKKIDTEQRLKEIEENDKNYKKKLKIVLKELKNPKELVVLVKSIQEMVFFRSFRMEIMYKSGIILKNLFQEIAKRVGVRYEEVIYYITPELIHYLKSNKKANKNKLKERKKEFACGYKDSLIHIYSGKELKYFKKKYKIVIEEVSNLTGMCACPGIAEGNVRIINKVREINNFKKGEILVCAMTLPIYVPAMEKAAAIVTDEGGITCHAAIVSRELGVPCVIGTKVSTKNLKNGDFIRVDASHGLISVIKKK